MARRLIVDTGVLIAAERGRFDLAGLSDDDVAIAAISVAEYRTGVELAADPGRAATRSRSIERIVSAVEVLDYTAETARHHALLLAQVRRAGRPRGAHDLIIAAHAAESGRELLTLDSAARFGELVGVSLAALPAS